MGTAMNVGIWLSLTLDVAGSLPIYIKTYVVTRLGLYARFLSKQSATQLDPQP